MGGRTALAVEIVRDAPRLRELEPAWRELADAVGARPFARPSWCTAWWETLGRGQLATVAVWAGPELKALAPLHLRPRPLVPALRFLGHGLGAVSAPLVAADRRDAAAALLWAAALRGRRVVELVEYDPRGDALASLRRTTGAVRVAPRDVCPVVRLAGDADRYTASRSAQLTRILRRSERRLDERGAVYSVDVVTDPAGVRKALPDVVRISAAAERFRPRQNLLAGRLGRFTRLLLRETALAGDLLLFVGRVDDEPAAYALTLRDGTGWAMWLNRHDPRFAEVGPGHLLLRAMVRHGYATGATHIDLLIGDHRYKRLWADEDYPTFDVTAAAGPLTLAVARAEAAATERIRAGVVSAGAGLRRPAPPGRADP